jgi:hypothetical protein
MAAATWLESDTFWIYSFGVHRPTSRHILASSRRSRQNSVGGGDVLPIRKARKQNWVLRRVWFQCVSL